MDAMNSDFARAGSLTELKAKGRLVCVVATGRSSSSTIAGTSSPSIIDAPTWASHSSGGASRTVS